MDNDKFLLFYERLYFHEMDLKEKLHIRVQIVFTLALIVATGITYIFKNLSYGLISIAVIIVILNTTSSLLLCYALFFLKKAFWDNVFKQVPTPNEITNYLSSLVKHRETIEKYNIEYPDHAQPVINPEQAINDFVLAELETCASHNMLINEQRSRNIHKATSIIFQSLIPLAVALILFLAVDLDLSSPRKSTESSKEVIIINNPYRL
ncbi:hypothetical protein B7R70_21210 [Yersinia pseudotuberculosis]|nr:hypothetical protein [Yersinia pseudotuberculosis]PSH23610.1 hypothetical protein BLA50_18425 [Yersinia pseudotuberculosis]PSH38588.1 hypothetical protein BA197_21055 [Yersinia pseudotuberculosis]PST77506.1 hypothetical protein B7R70_21210 [Yersinia pseudotuberculosis]